jgi:DNA-directed RNA polymerase specialized sigma24 family protein
MLTHQGLIPQANQQHALDERLVSATLRGDKRALEALLSQLLPAIRRRVELSLARRRTRLQARFRQECDDLVQEVVVRLLQCEGHVLRSWCPQRGLSLHSFVGLIAEREVGMHLRSAKRSARREDATECEHLQLVWQAHLQAHVEAAGCPHRELETRELLRSLLTELHARLSEPGRRALLVLFMEDADIEQAARLTGLSRDALYAWRSRITRLARDIHAQWHEAQAPIACATSRDAR